MIKLSEEQQKIIDKEGDVIVQANAGTGKTTVLTEKIKRELNQNRSYMTVAAITFTVKATNEIRSRLDKRQDCFIGTNNSFIMSEVIIPFFKFAYSCENGVVFKQDFSEKSMFLTFDEGLNLVEKQGVIGSYNIKQIKKNFAFELALNILKLSHNARSYLKAKYFKIFVDEYQDVDSEMHQFFKYLNQELKINLFIVGDIEQSIYGWKGAYPQYFEEFFHNDEFKKFKLTKNFRSSLAIKNFSRLVLDSDIGISVYKNKDVCICGVPRQNYAKLLSSIIDTNLSTALLRREQKKAETCANLFYSKNTPFKYLKRSILSELSSEHFCLYNEIALFLLKKDHSFYDVAYLFNNEFSIDHLAKLKNLFDKLELNYQIKDKELVVKNIHDIFSINKYRIEEEDLEKLMKVLFEKVENQRFLNLLDVENEKFITSSIHFSKGLEFEQVILFAEDFNLYEIEDRKLHYVAASRAKKKLIVVGYREHIMNNSKKYRTYIKSLLNKHDPPLKISDIAETKVLSLEGLP